MRSPSTPATRSSASRASSSRGGVADRRGCSQIAAERGAIADQRRSEQAQPIAKQMRRGCPALADLSQRQPGANLNHVRAVPEFAQLGDLLKTDQVGKAPMSQVRHHAKVGIARDELGRVVFRGESQTLRQTTGPREPASRAIHNARGQPAGRASQDAAAEPYRVVNRATAWRRGSACSLCTGKDCRPTHPNRNHPDDLNNSDAGEVALRTCLPRSPVCSIRTAIRRAPPWHAALRKALPISASDSTV